MMGVFYLHGGQCLPSISLLDPEDKMYQNRKMLSLQVNIKMEKEIT